MAQYVSHRGHFDFFDTERQGFYLSGEGTWWARLPYPQEMHPQQVLNAQGGLYQPVPTQSGRFFVPVKLVGDEWERAYDVGEIGGRILTQAEMNDALGIE